MVCMIGCAYVPPVGGNGDTNIPETQTYDISLPQQQNGYTLTASKSTVDEGEDVELTFAVLEGFEGGIVKVNGQQVDFNNGTCTIGNVNCDITITVEGVVEKDEPIEIDSYFFNDSTSITNDSFYKDFSEEDKQLYYTLWEDTTQISIKIDITPYELAKISEAYRDYASGNSAKADTYRKCNLTITVNGKDYYYEEVGVRMRGNTSRREFCDNDGNMYAFVHLRFDFGETFDGEEYQQGAWASELYKEWTDEEAREARKDRTFATMEKIYYKWNKNYDNTYIREVYANKMFQAYGVLAPHITIAQVSIGQATSMQNMGVCGLYETVDKEFIKRNMDKLNKGGDLYKCSYSERGPADLVDINNKYGIETATQRYSYDLKTNNDREDPDYHHNQHLKDLVAMLQTNKNDASFKQKLEALVDMDYFARFEAVNYLLGNPDCIRNNANNYYLYFTPEGRAIFIPYDYDRCLGINKDWNPSGSGMMYVKPYSTRTSAGDIKNPLYAKTILSSGLREYQQLYQSKLQLVLDGQWFNYSTFKAMYDNYSKNYASYAMPSDAIVQACKNNVSMDRFTFNEDGTKDFGSGNWNISTKDYMEIKRATALQYINDFSAN